MPGKCWVSEVGAAAQDDNPAADLCCLAKEHASCLSRGHGHCRVGRIFAFLGLRVGLAKELDEALQVREAFRADVTYTTPGTLAYAYLRDNSTALCPEDLVCPQ